MAVPRAGLASDLRGMPRWRSRSSGKQPSPPSEPCGSSWVIRTVLGASWGPRRIVEDKSIVLRMAHTSRALTLIAVLCSASACHSMARIRMSQNVRTEDRTVTLDLMIDAPGPVLSGPPHPVVDLCIPLVLYPLDKWLSFAIAVQAPFNADLDIQWGPVGALAGLTLPWVTLIPYIFPPERLADVDLNPEVFDEFCHRVQRGDGVRAYTELVQTSGWPGGFDALHSVRLHDRVQRVGTQVSHEKSGPRP